MVGMLCTGSKEFFLKNMKKIRTYRIACRYINLLEVVKCFNRRELRLRKYLHKKQTRLNSINHLEGLIFLERKLLIIDNATFNQLNNNQKEKHLSQGYLTLMLSCP